MDGGAARRIALASVDRPGDRVVEIGAGTGALTRALVDAGAIVTALEIDDDLVEILRARDDLSGVEVVAADALAFDYDAAVPDGAWCAAGNLPYNVATPLIMRLLELPRPPHRIVAMVQRDVADRFVARPSTPQYGSLTLAVSYAMSVRRAFALGPAVFHPRPNVDSAVVVMERHARPPVETRDPAFLLQVVRGAFAYRRKTLANGLALSLHIERARTQAALNAMGVDSEIRAEQLDLTAFGALADRLGA